MNFSKCCGSDEYICQSCHEIFCSKCKPPFWHEHNVNGRPHAGNICPTCRALLKIKNEIETVLENVACLGSRDFNAKDYQNKMTNHLINIIKSELKNA